MPAQPPAARGKKITRSAPRGTSSKLRTIAACRRPSGATVGTASIAAQRDYKIIVPVDCSAGEDVYNEQYAAYHLAKGGPAIVTSKVTMTRSPMVKF